MSFATKAALLALADLVKTIPGIEHVHIGAPESMQASVTTYLTIGASDWQGGRATQVYEAVTDLIVTSGYVVSGAEEGAEELLADAKDELDRRVLQNRVGTVTGTYQGAPVSVAPMLNGTVKTMEAPAPVSGAEYAMYAGQENRLRWTAIRVHQSESIG